MAIQRASFPATLLLIGALICALGLTVPAGVSAQAIEPTPEPQPDGSTQADGSSEADAVSRSDARVFSFEVSTMTTVGLYRFYEADSTLSLLANVLSYLQSFRGGAYAALDIRPARFVGVGIEAGLLGMRLTADDGTSSTAMIAFDLPLRFRVATELGPLLLRAFAGVNTAGYYSENSGQLILGYLAEAGLRLGIGPVVAEYSRLYGAEEDRGTTLGDHNRVGLGIAFQL